MLLSGRGSFPAGCRAVQPASRLGLAVGGPQQSVRRLLGRGQLGKAAGEEGEREAGVSLGNLVAGLRGC